MFFYVVFFSFLRCFCSHGWGRRCFGGVLVWRSARRKALGGRNQTCGSVLEKTAEERFGVDSPGDPIRQVNSTRSSKAEDSSKQPDPLEAAP